MRTKWTLFKIGGIPICADVSVLVLAAYLLFVMGSLVWGLFFVAVLLASILLHELAHSVVAIAFGGRVRDITLQLLGGCAAITRMPPKPSHEVLMAAAGPICSFALAAVGIVTARWFPTQYLMQDEYGRVIRVILPNEWLAMAGYLNLGLAIFNLVPAFPMDGGRILRSALQCVGMTKVRATEIAVWVGRGIAVIWAVTCVAAFLGISLEAPDSWPIAAQFMWTIVFGNGGIFLLLIALMIWVSGKHELDYVRYEDYYGGWR